MERTDAEHQRLARWVGELVLAALRRNAHKPHWLTMTAQERWSKMREEHAELEGAVFRADLFGGNPQYIIAEAADVMAVAAFEADAARVRMEAKPRE